MREGHEEENAMIQIFGGVRRSSAGSEHPTGNGRQDVLWESYVLWERSRVQIPAAGNAADFILTPIAISAGVCPAHRLIGILCVSPLKTPASASPCWGRRTE